MPLYEHESDARTICPLLMLLRLLRLTKNGTQGSTPGHHPYRHFEAHHRWQCFLDSLDRCQAATACIRPPTMVRLKSRPVVWLLADKSIDRVTAAEVMHYLVWW
jgi:hypothetical protein